MFCWQVLSGILVQHGSIKFNVKARRQLCQSRHAKFHVPAMHHRRDISPQGWYPKAMAFGWENEW